MPLLLTREDVEAVLTMDRAIEAVEEAFRQHHAGTVELPVRLGVPAARHEGITFYMPAYIGGEMDALGAKIVAAYPHNPARHNLPTIIATIVLNDAQSGQMIAVMDGTFITAMRTGAVTGVAARYMARSESETAGIFGAGVQARTQLKAICAVRDVKKALVYDIAPEAAQKYCQEMEPRLSIEVIPAPEPRQAAQGVDIVVTATTSKKPVFEDGWLAAGTHVSGVGAYTPEMQEIHPATMARARVVVDVREASLSEAGDLIIPINEGLFTADHIYADLGEIVSGSKPGRASSEEITVFKSVGLAIQDVSTAWMVYKLAKEKNIGQEVTL